MALTKEKRKRINHNIELVQRLIDEMRFPSLIGLDSHANRVICIDKQVEGLALLKPSKLNLLSYVRWVVRYKKIEKQYDTCPCSKCKE